MPLFFKLLAVALGAAVVACNHAPDEPRSDPIPLPDVASAPSSSAAGAARCIAPLASVAPVVPPAARERCPPDPHGNFKLARARVAFPEAGVAVDAELARTDPENERGLMYRKKMGEDEGMFFFLGDRRVQTFWMHNTCIPLDMLFIDTDGTIVGVVEDAPVLDDGPREVPCASRFVLEVNAGWTRRHNVRPGQHVIVPGG